MFGFGKKKKQSEPSFSELAEITKKVNKASQELDVTTLRLLEATDKWLAYTKRF